MARIDAMMPRAFEATAIVQSTRELFLDFEQELADLLRRSSPDDDSLSSSSSSSSSDGHLGVRRRSSTLEADFENDGTIACSNITYDLLCNISGRTSLGQLTSLTLCVKSLHSGDNLSLLSTCTPALSTLKLDHSKISSLRILGNELTSLKTLSICGCGLEGLDGITFAPNLLTLVAADNFIEEVLPVTELRKINTVDLENNAIEDYDSISFLFLCDHLENLVLKGNPISEDPEYRMTIFRRLPSLKTLDEVVMPRPSREYCRRNRKWSKEDEDNNGGANGAALSVEENQAEGTDSCSHQTKGKANEGDEIISKLLQDDSIPAKELDQPPYQPEVADVGKNEKVLAEVEGKGKEASKPLPMKLLLRRKSQDPLRLRDFITVEQEEGNPQSATPNLRLFFGSDTASKITRISTDPQQRPESSASVTSSSEATDSGVDFSSTSSGRRCCASNKQPPVKGRSGSIDILPKIRRGSSAVAEEEEQERLARMNRFIAMARENSDLSGVTRREGDIEIEDFDSVK